MSKKSKKKMRLRKIQSTILEVGYSMFYLKENNIRTLSPPTLNIIL